VLENLSSAGWQVTKNVTTKADEDNAVPGWIAAAPFDFSVGHCDPRTSLNMLCPAELLIVTCVGDDGDVLIAVHLIVIGPIGVSLAAAGLADQRHSIDQGHVPEPWNRKGQTLPPPKPTVRTSALALSGVLLDDMVASDMCNRKRAGLLTKGMWRHRNNHGNS
jgi:hypothetical protein